MGNFWTNAWDFDSDTVNGDMTLYAKWEVIRYTVSFNTNGGNGVSNQGVADGGHAVEPSPPTRSGYAFNGWYTDSGLTNAWNFGSDMVNSDMTLYAKWVITHTVTFNSNGGSAVASQQVAEGTHAAEPTAPTRSGHAFDGWHSDSGLSTAWIFGSDTVNRNITLYAKWVRVYHTVTFNSNSGTAVISQQVAEGTYATQPAAPTRNGYAFGGWYSDSGLSTAWTFGSDTVDRDITLYAKWVPLHTVTFDSNSGSAVASQQVVEGASVTEPAAPTRSGHAFKGWYWYSDSGLSTAWTFGSDTVNRDITLYAKWVIVYHTVTFYSNNGSAATSQLVAKGTSVTEPATPTRSGHVFGGWYSDINLSNAWTFGSDTVDGPRALYAKWLPLRTVTFESNGGSAVTSQQVAEGTYAAQPAAPTRSGYVFGGWYSDSSLSNAWTFGSDTVNSSITLYAKWSSTMPEMIFVQGGTFQMGSTDWGTYWDERPVHSVTVDSFYMAETEVTHEQFLEFLNDAGVSAAGQLNGNEVIDMDDGDVAFSHDGTEFSFAATWDVDDIACPVIEVTWYGAVEYSNWLSEQEGLSKAYSINGRSVTWNQSANGYRLPTEAEWEYAARGGAQSNGYKYAGSNNADEVGWYYGNSGRKTHPVKGKKANELGLYDMSGNVWEWCWDWYDSDYYSSSPGANPTGPSSGSDRMCRGGSWYNDAHGLRPSWRVGDSPSSSDDILGFRPVRRT